MNRLLHIRSFTLLIILSLMSVALLPDEASCRLTGEVNLGYADYESRANKDTYSGNSFNQRYSFLYDTSGQLVGGRLGSYSGSLGYEWLAYDTTENQSGSPKTKSQENRGHINYSGDVILNPKELPIKLHLYSQDPSRTTFSNTEVGSSLSGSGGYTSIGSNLTTGIDNGVHILSGATLVMGVKNGMTNGYNEVLRHFPMLMLDYRDESNKDLKRDYPVDNRLTRLAFVSLNKKDNWFHYRFVTYDDNIDSINNYTESQFQLGTVDHQLQRRWIDFTNWLSVSVDGQVTRRKNVNITEDFDEINLNLFGTARRQSWEMRTFNRFTRLNEKAADKFTYQTLLPVYASGIISPTAGWSAHVKYDDNHTNTGDSFTTINGSYSIDAFRKSPFTLVQGLNVEHVSPSSNANTLIVGGNIGTASTLLFSRDITLKANYTIRNYHSESDGNTPNNFLDQDVKTSARYSPTHTVNLIAQQDLRVTSGKAPVLGSTIKGAEVNNPVYQVADIASNSNYGGSGYQSITKLRVYWAPEPRLRVSLSGTENIYVPEFGERETLSRLSADLSYNSSTVTISSSLNYSNGNSVSNNMDSSQNNGGYDSESEISSINRARVIFNRSLDAGFGLNYFKTLGAGSVSTVNFEQSLDYRFRAHSGYARSVFEINESFISNEEVDRSGNNKKRHNTAQLGMKYFPTRQLMIAGGAKYFFINIGENSAVNYYGSISIGFRLLTASIDYAYGKNRVDDRVEKRLSANLKKKF